MGSTLVFLSYSHSDIEFANKLGQDLEGIGLSVWQDCKEIRPGDSISRRIEKALDTSDYFLLVLSTASISSDWVDREYRMALNLQLEKGKPCIIPICLHDVNPPSLLRDIRYVDFVKDYTRGWMELARFFDPTHLRPLRVGGSIGTGIYLLRLIVARFRERFPDLPIEERTAASDELIRSVAFESAEVCLDAAIVGKMTGDDLKETVECQEVFRDISVLTVPPGHPLWGKESISEGTLLSLLRKDTIFISRQKESGQYKAMLNYLEPRLGRVEAELLLDGFRASNLDSAKKFVSHGVGISIMPNVMVREDVLSGKMWAVRLPGNAYRSWDGVWAKKHHRSSVSEDFIMTLKEGLRPLEQE
jgi:DNA-binding transcriptional LysR family regulator